MRRAVVGPLAAMLVTSAIVLTLPLRTALNPYDEGLALIGGLRVLRGDVPFRDFAAVYPPAQSYVLAALFGAVGISIAVERAFDLIVRLLTACVIYAISTHVVASRWYAAALALMAALLLSSAGFFGYTTFPALLGTFAGVWAWFQYERRGAPGWLVASGAAAGATSGFGLDLGGVAVVTVTAGVALSHALGSRPIRRSAFARDLLFLGLGIAATALPFWWYVCTQAGWDQVWRQLWSHILIFRETRALPLPDPLPPLSALRTCASSLVCFENTWGRWARFYLPVVVLVGVVVHTGARIRRGEDPRHAIPVVVLAILTSGLYAKALTRYDAIHVLPALLGLLPLLGALTERTSRRRWRPLALSARAIGAVTAGLVYLVFPAATLAHAVRLHPPTGCYSERPIASCVPLWIGQEQVLTALDARVPATSALFIGLQRHDRAHSNDISLYFLAQRPVPTKYHELDPGVVDTDDVQREMIAELQRTGVEWLVLVDFPNPGEPNASSRSSGVSTLDDFIASRYRLVQMVSQYQLWRDRAQTADDTGESAGTLRSASWRP